MPYQNCYFWTFQSLVCFLFLFCLLFVCFLFAFRVVCLLFVSLLFLFFVASQEYCIIRISKKNHTHLESILIALRNQKKMDFEKKSHPILVLLQNQISKKMAYMEKTGGIFHKFTYSGKKVGFFSLQ